MLPRSSYGYPEQIPDRIAGSQNLNPEQLFSPIIRIRRNSSVTRQGGTILESPYNDPVLVFKRNREGDIDPAV